MTEKDYIKKHLILDAIKSTKPEPSEYMDMTDNIVVNTIILGAAVKQYEDIVKIVEAVQPTECKPVVHGRWVKIENTRNVFKCSQCGHIRELRHISEIISKPKLCEECGAKMDESEGSE